METQNTIKGIFTRANVFKECIVENVMVFNALFFLRFGYYTFGISFYYYYYSAMSFPKFSQDTLQSEYKKRQRHDFYRKCVLLSIYVCTRSLVHAYTLHSQWNTLLFST